LCVSAAILPSLKQIWMQICCFFTSVILAGQCDCKTAQTDITKMHRKNTHVLTAECCLAEWFTKGGDI
jgi:hypothetical protein